MLTTLDHLSTKVEFPPVPPVRVAAPVAPPAPTARGSSGCFTCFGRGGDADEQVDVAGVVDDIDDDVYFYLPARRQSEDSAMLGPVPRAIALLWWRFHCLDGSIYVSSQGSQWEPISSLPHIYRLSKRVSLADPTLLGESVIEI